VGPVGSRRSRLSHNNICQWKESTCLKPKRRKPKNAAAEKIVLLAKIGLVEAEALLAVAALAVRTAVNVVAKTAVIAVATVAVTRVVAPAVAVPVIGVSKVRLRLSWKS
jgi:hypothetical protein